MYEWRDLQFKVLSFMAILFNPRVFVRNLLRGSRPLAHSSIGITVFKFLIWRNFNPFPLRHIEAHWPHSPSPEWKALTMKIWERADRVHSTSSFPYQLLQNWRFNTIFICTWRLWQSKCIVITASFLTSIKPSKKPVRWLNYVNNNWPE